MHLHALLALQSVITTQGLTDDPVTVASLRVTFSGRPSPFLFSDLSEQVADLANVLTRCKLWDPAELRPKHSSLIGPPKLVDKSTPFAPARKMIVDPGTDTPGLVDVFLDDLISVFPALSDKHIDRCSLVALLALEVTSQPLLDAEPLQWEAMLAIEKAMAEGTPAEARIVL